MRGAFIEGDGPAGAETRGLDLDGCPLPRDLVLLRCRLPDAVLMRGTRVASVCFDGSLFQRGLAGDGLEARGGVFLRYGFESTGEVRLPAARIGSALQCSGGTFRAEKDAQGTFGAALAADGLEAKGGVSLRNVKATGEVRLLSARIGGSLECEGGKFRAVKHASGRPGSALTADGLEAKGGVLLRNGFEAMGQVRLVDARFGGVLDCSGGTFRAEEDATGERRLALVLDGLRADGGFFLRAGAKVEGVLDLTAAEVGDLNDEPECWPQPGCLILNRFRYGAITGGPVDAEKRVEWLDLQDPTRWGASFWQQPYEQLAKVLRETGHQEDAKTVLVKKERRSRRAEHPRLSAPVRLWRWVSWPLLEMVDYGYRPHRAVWPAILLVLVGAVVIDRAAAAGLLVPVPPARQDMPTVALVSLAYAFESFVPIVSLGQTAAFRPDMASVGGWWLQVFLWFHAFAGWLIGGAAAFGVLGMFRRGG